MAVMTEIEAYLCKLADEMHHLIKYNFAQEPNDAVHQRLQEIKDEIHRHGWEIEWSANLNPENPDVLDVEVRLLKPKSDMDPEARKEYDKWFRDQNNINEA